MEPTQPGNEQITLTIDDLLDRVDLMVQDGRVEAQWYFKALVGAAHEALGLKDTPRALGYLLKISPSYFNDELPKQTAVDAVFAQQAFEVADFLVKNAVVSYDTGSELSSNWEGGVCLKS